MPTLGSISPLGVALQVGSLPGAPMNVVGWGTALP